MTFKVTKDCQCFLTSDSVQNGRCFWSVAFLFFLPSLEQKGYEQKHWRNWKIADKTFCFLSE